MGVNKEEKTTSICGKFVIAGLAAMSATSIVHPFDLVKNRMQLNRQGAGGGIIHHKTSLHAVANVIKREGFFALYNGLSASVLRQGTYGTTRLGLYSNAFDMAIRSDGRPPKYYVKVLIAMVSGGISAMIWTPTDVALVRMLADGRLPPTERRGYSNVFNALYRICREEGVLTLWRGCLPTVTRATIVNGTQLSTYSQAKQMLLSTGYFPDNIVCHFCASMMAGIVVTAASTPIDVAKTRIQNMHVINGKPEYSGIMDVFGQTIRKEGFFSLWKGFMPYYARAGPYCVFLFLFLEQLNKLYQNYSRG